MTKVMFLACSNTESKRVVELKEMKKKLIFYPESKTFNKTNNPIKNVDKTKDKDLIDG